MLNNIDKSKLIPIKYETQTVTAATKIAANCSDITFINKGAANCIVEGVTIAINDSFTDSCNEYELNTGFYNISFSGSGTKLLIVRRKYYVGYEQ